MTDTVVDITPENAQALLIDESFQRPVMVDFWADWCGPCKSLAPILEKLATEYQGQFLLAKVNADEQQMIAAQFGVRSLPTVMIIRDGQPLDGFAGAQSEQQVRELLDKYLPKPWDIELDQAMTLLADGKASDALSLLKSAYQSSGQRADIAIALAKALVASKRFDEAESILAGVKMVDQDTFYEQVKAELELAREAKRAPELETLEAKLKEHPDDKELKYKLAVQYSQHEFHREALTLLFELIRQDLNFGDGEAKKMYMDILAVLGKADPLAVEFQRKLYTLLY